MALGRHSSADAVVVGAGVIGSSIAHQLARAGRRVVVVDKGGGVGHGSTSASSAIVRFTYSTFDGVATSWEALHIWKSWAEHLDCGPDGSPLARFVRTGMVLLDAPPVDMDRLQRLLAAVGVPHERWDDTMLRARLAGIDTGRYWPPKAISDDAFFDHPSGQLGALYTPDAGYVDDPQLAAQNLADAAVRHGTEIRLRVAVVGLTTSGGRVSSVLLSDGSRIATPVVVNAAGPWSGALNRLCGIGDEFTIAVRPLRQEVHQIPINGAISPGPEGLPAIADLDLGGYTRPAPSGMLLVGGTEPECDPLEWLEDPDAANPLATAERFEAQVLRAVRRLPGLGMPPKPSGIAGVYDVADDWTPIFDRTDVDGFYVAIGSSGNQFKNAPLIGLLMAELIRQVEAGHDHDREPVTFRAEHTGTTIDLGSFSRKRAVIASTGTVMG
jgi:glycine/D-amino acid oxidase-like deaminating enzyme